MALSSRHFHALARSSLCREQDALRREVSLKMAVIALIVILKALSKLLLEQVGKCHTDPVLEVRRPRVLTSQSLE